jgi:RNA recognition motif-containing protein
MSQARLFVGNLSFQTGENDLQDYFAQAGAVTSVNLMLDKMTGRSRGFAFVEYATAEEAQKAIEQFHDKDFQGRKITVNVARPREERPPRSGGGFGGGGGERRFDRGERRERY